ncbi:MAG: hypothetical protein VB112_02985 [Oscillospiraceae bacterium]|nr:hypothetical protein [Oscillospiraceae bacterium]
MATAVEPERSGDTGVSNAVLGESRVLAGFRGGIKLAAVRRYFFKNLGRAFAPRHGILVFVYENNLKENIFLRRRFFSFVLGVGGILPS